MKIKSIDFYFRTWVIGVIDQLLKLKSIGSQKNDDMECNIVFERTINQEWYSIADLVENGNECHSEYLFYRSSCSVVYCLVSYLIRDEDDDI